MENQEQRSTLLNHRFMHRARMNSHISKKYPEWTTLYEY